MTAKYCIKYCLPPLFIELFKALSAKATTKRNEWAYLPDGWQDSDVDCQGWYAESIVKTQLDKWSQFVTLTEGNGPLGIAHESSLLNNQNSEAHTTIMSFAYVAALAAHKTDSLSILDWGGGLGHYGVLVRALLPGVTVDYHCKDLPLLCLAGRNCQSGFTFHESEDSCFSRDYDLVIASSSMHYSKDWRAVFTSLSAATSGYLYITRIPMVVKKPSFVVLQRPYMHGYETEYSGWFINQSDFLNHSISLKLELVREFLVPESPDVENAPERCNYKGFLFRHTPI